MKLDKFKPIPFDSLLDVEVLECKSMNKHRVIINVQGKGKEFTETDLEQLRSDIKANLSLSRTGNFAFHLVLHDTIVTDDFHYKMVDDYTRSGGSCLWSIIIDNDLKQAKGIHTWQIGGATQIYEDILKQYPHQYGLILNRYKSLPQFLRWLEAIRRPWILLNPNNRPWNPRPKFAPPFDDDEDT
jgi:hypothetical protein